MPISPEKFQLLQTVFRPHAAIEDPDSFVGRVEERRRVREAVSTPGLQVVIYGEPGCGKTSLANVATRGFLSLKVFCEADANFARILRDIAMQYQKTDPARLQYNASNDTICVAGITLPVGRMTGNNFLSLLPSDSPLCILLDELDRVVDRAAVGAIAELIKNAATTRPNLTFIMVGVAETANGVLAGHASNYRNIRQIRLGRMPVQELRGILNRGEQLLNITFSEEAAAEMLQLCDGLPYYLHLWAKSAARHALELGSPTVELDDLVKGSREAAADADQQLRTTYDHAILCEKGTRIYKRILWAMANLPEDSNNSAVIANETNKITLDATDSLEKTRAVDKALQRLASEAKGMILLQPIDGVYKFASPLMKGFIRLIRYNRQ